MVRVNNLTKWDRWARGDRIPLRGQERRRVRLELNCPEYAKVYYVGGTRGPVFLAAGAGLVTVTFTVPDQEGTLEFVSDDHVWVYSDELSSAVAPRPDSPSFVRPMQRRERNHDLEVMMGKQRMNIERRLALQEEDMRRFMARLEASVAAATAVGVKVNATTGEVENEPEERGGSAGGAGEDQPPAAVPGAPGAAKGKGAKGAGKAPAVPA